MALAPAGHGALAQSASDTPGLATDAGGVGYGSRPLGNNEPGSGGPVTAMPSVLTATAAGGVGPDVRLGHPASVASLGNLPPAPRAERNWSYTPQIGISEEYTTGRTGVAAGGRSGSFITSLDPSIAVSGDTARLRGNLFYAPEIQFYIPGSNQNRVNQTGNARFLATIVPQTLFFDLRASASVTAITPGQAPITSTNLNRSNTTQSFDFSASPYALHRYGPWGTGEVGATFTQTLQNALSGAGPQTAQQASIAALHGLSNQNATSYGGHVAFTTGEAFARYNAIALAQGVQFDGSGVLEGAYRDTATVDSGYALTRAITALATTGYERIHYSGTSPISISDMVLMGGIRITPNADSLITLRYGHQDGFNSARVDAVFAPTARTRIYARYSAGLTTQAEQQQNALATSDIDALGNPVDHATGAPLVTPGNFFGIQNGLFRTSIASVTLALSWERDDFSLSVNSQSQTLISASSLATLALANSPNGIGAGSNHGVSGSGSWTHQLSPILQSTLYGQYGVTSGQASGGAQRLTVLSAALSYALSRTVSAHLQYSYNRTSGGSPANSQFGNVGTQHQLLASLVKSF